MKDLAAFFIAPIIIGCLMFGVGYGMGSLSRTIKNAVSDIPTEEIKANLKLDTCRATLKEKENRIRELTGVVDRKNRLIELCRRPGAVKEQEPADL